MNCYKILQRKINFPQNKKIIYKYKTWHFIVVINKTFLFEIRDIQYLFYYSTCKIEFGNKNWCAFTKMWEWLRFGTRYEDLISPQIKKVFYHVFELSTSEHFLKTQFYLTRSSEILLSMYFLMLNRITSFARRYDHLLQNYDGFMKKVVNYTLRWNVILLDLFYAQKHNLYHIESS